MLGAPMTSPLLLTHRPIVPHSHSQPSSTLLPLVPACVFCLSSSLPALRRFSSLLSLSLSLVLPRHSRRAAGA